MFRCVSVLVVLAAAAGPAAAGTGTDIVELDGEVIASPLDASVGGSVHYEHRFESSDFGVTLRGGTRIGEEPFNDDRRFWGFYTLVGLREHWGPLHFEAGLGVGIGKEEKHLDGYGQPAGGNWALGPQFDLEVGRRFGPVEVSLCAAVLGLGLRLGTTFGG